MEIGAEGRSILQPASLSGVLSAFCCTALSVLMRSSLAGKMYQRH
jgi:hypothetical protein